MRAVAAAALGFLLPAAAAPAAAFEPLDGAFAAAEACEAHVALRQRRNPDGARLVPGERYAVRGRNQAGGEWLQVEVPGAVPAARWVEERCGALQGSAARPGTGLRPFFDIANDGFDDPSPPPPPLDALDRAVLAACGPWGSRPRRAGFRDLLDRPEAAEVLRALDASDRRSRDELADVWSAEDGFRHVFCGEPEPDGIAGLHYRGRYLELQEAGLAGLADPGACRREIDPPVYTLGVRYLLPGDGDGPPRTACPKSYDAGSSAADILVAGARAWRGSRGQRMCLASLGRGRWAVAVLGDEGLRTFYPDPSPRCDGGSRPASCACGD